MNQRDTTTTALTILIGLFLFEERHKMGLCSDEDYKDFLDLTMAQYAELVETLSCTNR